MFIAAPFPYSPYTREAQSRLRSSRAESIIASSAYKHFAPNGANTESDRIVAGLRLFFQLVSIAVAAFKLAEKIQLFIVFQTHAHCFRVLFDH